MYQHSPQAIVVAAALVACLSAGTALPARGQGNLPNDPTGILRKAIPDRLTVLTFDDACASHATIVAPILQSLGFGGSFYVCWPLYGVVWNICPDLTKHGYTFGRGGHERPYRPTVDNPFDVPSFTIHDRVPVEAFIKQAQQTCQGRVVVYTFHGVPDGEHPSVGLQPATFKAMMQYLKANNYKVIAMRDLAEYIIARPAIPNTSREQVF